MALPTSSDPKGQNSVTGPEHGCPPRKSQSTRLLYGVWDSGEEVSFARNRRARAYRSAWQPTAKFLYAEVRTHSFIVLVARSFGNADTFECRVMVSGGGRGR